MALLKDEHGVRQRPIKMVNGAEPKKHKQPACLSYLTRPPTYMPSYQGNANRMRDNLVFPDINDIYGSVGSRRTDAVTARIPADLKDAGRTFKSASRRRRTVPDRR